MLEPGESAHTPFQVSEGATCDAGAEMILFFLASFIFGVPSFCRLSIKPFNNIYLYVVKGSSR